MKKIFVLSLLMIGILVPFVVFGAEMFEYYNTGDDQNSSLRDIIHLAQTFTPSVAHRITSVKLKLGNKELGIGSVGITYAVIKATDGEGKPTGAGLCSGTMDGDTITTDPNGLWYEISLGAGCDLNANTQYAIVVFSPDAVDVYAYWRGDATSPTYAGGNMLFSQDSEHIIWENVITKDQLFEVWGTTTPPPPPPIVPLPTGFTTSILANVGELFTDLSSLVGLTIGLPIGFWGIKKVISLAKFR